MSALSIAGQTHLRAPPSTLNRLLIFVAASLALHVATLASYTPSGSPDAPYGGPAEPQVLHATLTAPHEPALAAPEPADTQQVVQSAVSAPEAANEARAGSAQGTDAPLPSKWYEPSELDVRAKPLMDPPRTYPEELLGSGLTGRVRVLLFIDERGVVRRARIVASQPEGVFDKAAIKAWQEVRFEPARKNGVAVKSRMLLEGEYSP